jgi:hypothetical protein
MSPLPRRGGKRRLVRRGETYTAYDADAVELETVEPDEIELPEAAQHGDLEHEGGPDDGSH